MSLTDAERDELEAACLEGLVDTKHGYRYRPSVGAVAVEAIVARRVAAAVQDTTGWQTTAEVRADSPSQIKAEALREAAHDKAFGAALVEAFEDWHDGDRYAALRSALDVAWPAVWRFLDARADALDSTHSDKAVES